MPLNGVLQVGWVVRDRPDGPTLITRWHVNGEFSAAGHRLEPESLIVAYPECEITWDEYVRRYPDPPGLAWPRTPWMYQAVDQLSTPLREDED
jgi:hypothetical protein